MADIGFNDFSFSEGSSNASLLEASIQLKAALLESIVREIPRIRSDDSDGTIANNNNNNNGSSSSSSTTSLTSIIPHVT